MIDRTRRDTSGAQTDRPLGATSPSSRDLWTTPFGRTIRRPLLHVPTPPPSRRHDGRPVRREPPTSSARETPATGHGWDHDRGGGEPMTTTPRQPAGDAT